MEDDTRNIAAFDAVVSLLQDLDFMLRFYDHEFGSTIAFSRLFKKEKIQVMYDDLSSALSLLTDSSGDAEWTKFWIRGTAEEAQRYIVSKVRSLIGPTDDASATADIRHDHRSVGSMVPRISTFYNDLPLRFRLRSMNCLSPLTNDNAGQYHTVLDVLLGISKEEVHFVRYDAVALLLHDLELILRSHWHTSDSVSHPGKGDFEIMYDNLSEMVSLLIDSQAKGYDEKEIRILEDDIRFVAYIGLDYIDSWPRIPNIREPAFDSILDMITERIQFDLQYKMLKRVQCERGVIRKATKISQGKTYTGLFSAALKLFRKTPSEGSRWVGHEKHLLTKPDHLEPNIEFQTSSSVNGLAQISCPILHQVTRLVEFVNNQLQIIHEGRDFLQISTQSSQSTTSTGQDFPILNRSDIMPNKPVKLVGFEQDFLMMLDRLTGYPPKLQVFAVLGMGGIGKTTFSRSLYDDPSVKHHFNIRAWFTISQHYQLREVLIGLLHCITDSIIEIYGRGDEELKDMLYKSLKGRKYFIVLDDMWDKKVWDDLKIIFPEDKNGSRMILTSRLNDVANHVSPNTSCHLHCLDEDKSWELLSSKIFVKELCPKLLSIGKEISRKCQGLPLAIVVIGGLLSNKNQTVEAWKDVEQSVSTSIMKESNHFENILALSYNHLPDHLKRCFLYMGVFPEDFKFSAKKLIWLWIGEGFVQPRELKNFEEVAENYLEELISRNLVQANTTRADGRIKTCYIHDMLRDLCLKKSHELNFFHVYDSYGKSMKQIKKQGFLLKCRRFCYHSSNPDITTISSLRTARSILWFKTMTSSDLESYLFMDFKLLKVLDINDVHLEGLPTNILMPTHLTYLAISFRGSIDRSIFSSTFHNIQILIVEGEWNGQLPEEFWAMSELRHFQLKRSFLSYWPKESRPNIMQLASASKFPHTFICQVQYEERLLKAMQNLQSLTTIRPICCTKTVFLSMPNLKKLGVYEDEEDYGFRGWFKFLIHLKELQTLKYVFRDPYVSYFMKPDRLPSLDFFFPKLMKLTLCSTSFPWEDMLKLSALPSLEVLKLKNYAFSGATWKSKEDGFPRLKYLLIGRTNLQLWEADSTHFPCLKHLVITNCRALKEIPFGFAKSCTLERIELYDCSESASDSVEQILQEQQDYGNYEFVVHISRIEGQDASFE